MRKYILNESIFSKIKSKEQAYWLGFIAADGSVSKYTLSLEIHNRDIAHINNFKKFMQSSALVKPTRKNCSRIRLNSRALVLHLGNLGILPNKSKTLLTPKYVSSHFLRDFYRGVFDGDGWITSRIRKPARTKRKRRNNFGQYYSKNARYCEIGFCSGSSEFIMEIHNWIKSQIKIDCGKLTIRRKKNQLVYQLIFGGNQIFEQIINLLYKDASNYLERKKQIAISLLSLMHQ